MPDPEKLTRPPRKRRVEECFILSLCDLRDAGLLRPGLLRSGTYTCLRREGGAAQVGYEVDTRPGREPTLTVAYTVRRAGGQSEDVQLVIPLTVQNTGRPGRRGQRYLLLCPMCGRRGFKLYLADGRFACRACHNLGYTSQQQTRPRCRNVATEKSTTMTWRAGDSEEKLEELFRLANGEI